MTTYEYYSIPFRTGLLILILACLAIANLIFYLQDVMSANYFKFFVAAWALVGCIATDISKNAYLQWRNNKRRSLQRESLTNKPPRLSFGG